MFEEEALLFAADEAAAPEGTELGAQGGDAVFQGVKPGAVGGRVPDGRPQEGGGMEHVGPPEEYLKEGAFLGVQEDAVLAPGERGLGRVVLKTIEPEVRVRAWDAGADQ